MIYKRRWPRLKPGRKIKAPRLWLRKDRWIILHKGRQMRTGCSAQDVDGARAALERYRSTSSFLHGDDAIKGYVYFISTRSARTFPIKIGHTARKPDSRLADLQTGAPFKLKLLAWMPARRSSENDVHNRFSRERLEGEWFRRSARLIRFVNEVAAANQGVAEVISLRNRNEMSKSGILRGRLPERNQ